MKRFITALICALSAVPALAEVGVVVQGDRGVIIRGDETIAAVSDTAVEEGDLLSTTPSGLIHILMNDGTKFVVGASSTISIDTALVNDSGNAFESIAVGLTGGVMRFLSGGSENEAYEFNTPSATMGIRGTACEISHSVQSKAICFEGSIDFCLRDDEGNRIESTCKVVEPNCEVLATTTDDTEIPEDQSLGEFGIAFLQDNDVLEPYRVGALGVCGQDRLPLIESLLDLEDVLPFDPELGDDAPGAIRPGQQSAPGRQPFRTARFTPFSFSFSGSSASSVQPVCTRNLAARIQELESQISALAASGTASDEELTALQARRSLLILALSSYGSNGFDEAQCLTFLASCGKANSPAGECQNNGFGNDD